MLLSDEANNKERERETVQDREEVSSLFHIKERDFSSLRDRHRRLRQRIRDRDKAEATTTTTTRRPTFSNLVIEQYEGQCGRRLNSYRRGVKQQHDIKIDILKRHVNTAPLPSRAELICLGFHEAGQIFSFYLCIPDIR